MNTISLFTRKNDCKYHLCLKKCAVCIIIFSYIFKCIRISFSGNFLCSLFSAKQWRGTAFYYLYWIDLRACVDVRVSTPLSLVFFVASFLLSFRQHCFVLDPRYCSCSQGFCSAVVMGKVVQRVLRLS